MGFVDRVITKTIDYCNSEQCSNDIDKVSHVTAKGTEIVARVAFEAIKKTASVGVGTVKLTAGLCTKDTGLIKDGGITLVKELAIQPAKGIIRLSGAFGGAAIDSVQYVYGSITHKEHLKKISLRRIKHKGATLLVAIGTAMIVGEILHTSFCDIPVIHVGLGLLPDIDINSLPGIENNTLIDNSGLEWLIQAGQLNGTTHIASEDIIRNMSARIEFLNQINLTTLPEGYDIHHIVPLSEGGADTTDNMVLVPEDAHEIITNAHRSYYSWQ